MIKILYDGQIDISEILCRGAVAEISGEVQSAVRGIIGDVRLGGDGAVKAYEKKFDGCELNDLKVSEEEIDAAYGSVGADFIKTLEKAAENIREFHLKQKRDGFEIKRADGTVLGQRILPVRRAGVYVPGGTAAYPSTVLMDVIPAVVAGVDEIAMATPPDKNGKVKAEILAAAKVAGVTEIFKMGGAQAIAAFAYGTESVKRTDKIVGPGNIYVATAKKEVSGLVGIDMFAGPSEILIIADGGANPEFLAADLLSQAEHDVLASAVLITTSDYVAKATAAALERRLDELPRADIARRSIESNGKIIIVGDLSRAAEISDLLAPEHLEIMTENPRAVLSRIRNAGSVFLGEFSPEPVGDYFAGPNHTLPTSGTARFSSPLGVDDFTKRSSYIEYSSAALDRDGAMIADFAEREGLSAHARSITVRLNGSKS